MTECLVARWHTEFILWVMEISSGLKYRTTSSSARYRALYPLLFCFREKLDII